MATQLRSLLWKEWHERRMQFLACMIWMVCGTLYCIAHEWSHASQTYVLSFRDTAFLFGLFMPLFLAMRTSLGETTDGTRSFSEALPISSRRRGWIRLASGAGALIVPILTGAVLLSLCLAFRWIHEAPPSRTTGPGLGQGSLSVLSAVGLVWCYTAIALWAATSLYVLLSLIGTMLRKEAHAGFVGTVVVFLWFLGMCFGVELKEMAKLPASPAIVGAIVPLAMIFNFSYGDACGTYGDLLILGARLWPLLVNSILQFALATWFVSRYSHRLSPGRAEESHKKTQTIWRPWSLPLPTRSIALTWLTLRQSVPMCIPGLLLACLMTFFQMKHPGPVQHGEFLRQYTDAMSSSTWVIGLMWAVVVGAGVFSAEIDPRVGEFWRTWPVPFWHLFTIKFLIGLLAVLIVLDGTTIAASWNSPNWGDYRCMNWPYIACIVPWHATMFAVAVAWACLLRRPVLGGMAALGSFAMMTLGLEWWETTRPFDPLEVYNNLALTATFPPGPVDFTAHGYPVVATAMGLILLASGIIAGLALQRYAPRLQPG